MAPAPLSSPHPADVVVAGAGLAGALLALRLKARRPELKVVVIDGRDAAAEDGHTWSYFASDVEGAVRAWLDPLAARRWDGYAVRFPRYRRDLSTPYASLTGEGLRRALDHALGPDLLWGRRIVEVAAERVAVEGGEVWRAPLVIDARGARPSRRLQLAWQKFVGLELQLSAPHGLERPVVMDAGVEQLDGYRFVYVLPFAPDRCLVEDTYYSSDAALDRGMLEARVRAYATGAGWRVERVVRREEGVLPIVLGGDLEGYLAEGATGAASVGLRAPLFHPVTGYSLPDAAAIAQLVSDGGELTSAAVRARVEAQVRRRWRDGGYLRLLNRMLFQAAAPEARYRVLQRFYRLPQPLIERFYANRLTLADQGRILAGRPPVPLLPALRAMAPRRPAPAD